MKILFIAPWNPEDETASRNGYCNDEECPSFFDLLSLAAETPGKHEFHIVDERIAEMLTDGLFDLVFILCLPTAVQRSLAIATVFRGQGIPVILGGRHLTEYPDEAFAHADAIILGEATGIWHTVLADAEAGMLQKIYRRPFGPVLHETGMLDLISREDGPFTAGNSPKSHVTGPEESWTINRRIAEKTRKVLQVLGSNSRYRNILADLLDAFHEAVSSKKINLTLKEKMKELEKRLRGLENKLSE